MLRSLFKVVLKLLNQGEGAGQTGVMIPVPFPYTLPRVLERVGSVPVPYYLRKEERWRIMKGELHRALQTSKGHCWPRAIYISNPGNPTGTHYTSRCVIRSIHIECEYES